jgi:hypothetical protein
MSPQRQKSRRKHKKTAQNKRKIFYDRLEDEEGISYS